MLVSCIVYLCMCFDIHLSLRTLCNISNKGSGGLPNVSTLSPWAVLCYYCVTLSFYANSFSVFIVVLVALDCGFKLWYVVNTSTFVLL